MTGFLDELINRSVAANAGNGPGTSDEEITDELVEDGATSGETRTLKEIRETIQELLKHGLLGEAGKPNLYRVVLTRLEEVIRILKPLDLDIGTGEIHGLLYIKVGLDEAPEQDEQSHPLVRRQWLNLGQSLLVAILCQHFAAWEQGSGTGTSQTQIAIDNLLPQLQIYLGDPGSESKERTRLLTLVDQLKGRGLVTSPDTHERVVIRPVIAHLANPMNLQTLLAWLWEQVAQQTSPDGSSAGKSSEEDV